MVGDPLSSRVPLSPAIPKVKRMLYWKCFNSIPDSVCDSEISSDDSGTDDLGISSAYHATEVGWSDLDSPVRIPTSTKGGRVATRFFFI